MPAHILNLRCPGILRLVDLRGAQLFSSCVQKGKLAFGAANHRVWILRLFIGTVSLNRTAVVRILRLRPSKNLVILKGFLKSA